MLACRCVKAMVVSIIATLGATTGSAYESLPEPIVEVPFPEGTVAQLPVTLRGKSMTWMVDTGATGTVIDRSIARELNLRPIGRLRAFGASRDGSLPIYDVRSRLWSDTRPLGDVDAAAVVDMTLMRQASGQNLQGFLGINFLKQGILELNFDHERWTLFPNVGTPMCFPDAQEYNIEINNNYPLVHVQLPSISNPVNDVRARRYLLDTGDNGLCSGHILAEDFGALERAGAIHVVDVRPAAGPFGSVTSRLGRLKELRLGTLVFRGLIFSESHSSSESRDGALGLRFLSRFNVTFDFPRKKLYLAPRKKPFEAFDRIDMSGLLISRHPGAQTYVHGTIPSSPAALAGILSGDHILRVAGQPVETYTLHALRKLLTEEGQTVPLVFRRANREFPVELKLENWRTRKVTEKDFEP